MSDSSGGSRISQGGAYSQGGGERQPIILHNFCRKLHENERF